MKGMPSAEVMAGNWPATSICSASLSTTQGPAIRKKGRSRPTSKPQSFTGPPWRCGRSPAAVRESVRSGAAADRRSCSDLQPLLPHRLALQRRADEAVEQRVAVPRGGLELGVELHADEPGVHVARQLDDLGQLVGLRDRREHEPRLAQAVEVVRVGLVAVAVAFGDDVAVDVVRQRAALHVRALRAQAHRAAQVGARVALLDRAVAVLPLLDQPDHRMRRRRLELGRVGVRKARDMARELDRRDLHAQADAEVRDALLAREACRADLALDPALAEAAGHQHRVEARQLVDVVAVQRLGVDVLDVDPRVVLDAGVAQRLVQRLLSHLGSPWGSLENYSKRYYDY